MATPALTARVIEAARARGFVGVAVCAVEPFERGGRALAQWLANDHHGEMTYMAKHARRAEPRSLLAQARSLIVVALPYARDAAIPNDGRPRGFVARYARGRDYHAVLKEKLYALADDIAGLAGGEVAARPCVDSAPILEREAAHRAGLGFIAKNTMTILPGVGSYVLLGELLVDVELDFGEPAAPKCGECTACIDACPTGAIVDAHVLDARKCISYLTIELSGSIPVKHRASIGTMVFGCDICQEACPFNASPDATAADPALAPRADLVAPELVRWLELSSSDYRRLVKDTALRRASRNQLARNAAVALGNTGDPAAVEPLCRALAEHISPLVRGHAAWALGQLGGDAARAALSTAAATDPDPEVAREARAARALIDP